MCVWRSEKKERGHNISCFMFKFVVVFLLFSCLFGDVNCIFLIINTVFFGVWLTALDQFSQFYSEMMKTLQSISQRLEKRLQNQSFESGNNQKRACWKSCWDPADWPPAGRQTNKHHDVIGSPWCHQPIWPPLILFYGLKWDLTGRKKPLFGPRRRRLLSCVFIGRMDWGLCCCHGDGNSWVYNKKKKILGLNNAFKCRDSSLYFQCRGSCVRSEWHSGPRSETSGNHSNRDKTTPW